MSMTTTVPPYPVLATVDLGSNSFRLQISRVVDDQLYTLDSLKETVRLGAGLTSDDPQPKLSSVIRISA